MGSQLYAVKEIKACEQMAVSSGRVTFDSLMERAGHGAFSILCQEFPAATHLAVYCGGGNNAGDGFILARLAHQAGLKVSLYTLKNPDDLSLEAAYAAQKALEAGLAFKDISAHPMSSQTEVIVDGILGTGFQGTLNPSFQKVITSINQSNIPVLSLDVPSGLYADTGATGAACVKASITVTFVGPKVGLFTGDGPDHAGKIHCDDLDLGFFLSAFAPKIIEWQPRGGLLSERKKNSHKNAFGHVLIAGGSPGMPGAVQLAAHAALRSGAGVVSAVLHPDYGKQLWPLLPEVMVHGFKKPSDLKTLLQRASVCVIGTGLGLDEWAETLFHEAMKADIPLIVDGGALRFLARNPEQRSNWILTPHPGEAACLLGFEAHEIQADRYTALQSLYKKYHGQIVLKGHGTLTSGLDKTYICTRGSAGMATAGMGDALCGVIAGLLAQGMAFEEAASAGVWLHASAGDEAVLQMGMRGLKTSDLMPYIQKWVNFI